MNRTTPLALVALVASLSLLPAAEFSVETVDDGVVIKIDGELFTKYITKGEGNKPYFWPVIGPTGKKMTRAYPMEDVEGEKQDHPHHRSMWFGQQEINGFDTWHERLSFEERYAKKPEELEKALAGLGATRHDEVVTAKAMGDHAILETASTYLNSSGEEMVKDQRRFVFKVDPETGSRIVDVDLTFVGSEETVTMGDAKDAGFSLRVAWSMSVDAGEGAHIVNSEGDMDKEAWSKKAKWCDFYGPVDGETVGVAMLNHPSSFRYPTPWHVRTYGLFTANPFGLQSLDKSAESGSFDLKKGETFNLRYRVIFHKGDAESANLDKAFEAYAAEKF